MSSSSKAWLVAASIGGVEALKDQGFCRWNYALRNAQRQAANTNVLRSNKTTKKPSSSSSAMLASKMVREEEHHKLKQSEDSLRKVMYLSCWAPN